jgi:hypothetical protein
LRLAIFILWLSFTLWWRFTLPPGEHAKYNSFGRYLTQAGSILSAIDDMELRRFTHWTSKCLFRSFLKG